MYSLRPPRSDDFEPLLALQTTAYRGWIEGCGGAWDDARARSNLAAAIVCGVEVVEIDHRRVGALAVRWDEDPIVLDGIEIATEHQGRGLGTRIVHDVIRRAALLGRDVVLEVLRSNPSAALYQRLGFRRTGETATHQQMRWTADTDSLAALARAMSPWLDEHRRARWVARAFAEPLDAEVGFLRFVVRRHGLPEILRALGEDDASSERLRLLGTRAIAPDENDLDLVLASDGGFLEHCTHERRRFAAEQALRRLRPGGIFLVDAPNMPWVLRHEPDPVPRTLVYFDALVSRITDRSFDFHAGTMSLVDTFVVEVEGAPTIEWKAERRLAIIGKPEVELALREAGFVAFGTFTDLSATAPGYVRGRRLLLVAVAPG